MYHIGHKNQRNAKANKSAGQTRKSSSTTLCAIDVETRSCLRYPLHTYAHSKRQTYLVTPPLIQIVLTHPARNLTPPPPKRTHKNYILTNAHTNCTLLHTQGNKNNKPTNANRKSTKLHTSLTIYITNEGTYGPHYETIMQCDTYKDDSRCVVGEGNESTKSCSSRIS